MTSGNRVYSVSVSPSPPAGYLGLTLKLKMLLSYIAIVQFFLPFLILKGKQPGEKDIVHVGIFVPLSMGLISKVLPLPRFTIVKRDQNLAL